VGFITILDDNQIKERKFKHTYGRVNLVDCQIELLPILGSSKCYEMVKKYKHLNMKG